MKNRWSNNKFLYKFNDWGFWLEIAKRRSPWRLSVGTSVRNYGRLPRLRTLIQMRRKLDAALRKAAHPASASKKMMRVSRRKPQP